MRLLAGASGYSYKEWKGNFYPADIKPDAMLAWYAERLPTVEINNTFYRMPKANLLESWAASTPESWRGSSRKRRPIRSVFSTRTWRRSAPSAARCFSSCRRS